ncbi:MAG: D-glycero-beta-D-manno-heptose 1-phosphate adenylyltransferase [Fusobacterium sp.]|nr:D-glycero-beta-D-manno-heptose 1-phosphate adenylyltransferase [Fusobacterium sp.]
MNINKDLAKYIINLAKEQGKKVVFTNGCFDILHVGHISYLEMAKKQGDILIVGVNSDESTKRLKGPTRPINSEKDRAAMLSALKAVDYTVIFEEDTPEDLIAYLKPSIHVKGGDYKKENLPETKIVEAYGGKVIILNFVEGKSTTNIINKINKQQ